jgi:hypothetical protein
METGRHLRPYAITRGRTRHSRHSFTLITLIAARFAHRTESERLGPEEHQILDLCRNRAVAVAEIAAHLDLPVSVVKVLCGDLLNDSLILVQAPPGQEDQPSLDLIEKVIHGLRHRL